MLVKDEQYRLLKEPVRVCVETVKNLLSGPWCFRPVFLRFIISINPLEQCHILEFIFLETVGMSRQPHFRDYCHPTVVF